MLEQKTEDAMLLLGLYEGDYGMNHANPEDRPFDKAKLAFYFGIIMHLCSKTDPETTCLIDIVHGFHLCGTRRYEGVHSEINFIVIGCAGQTPNKYVSRLAGYLSAAKAQKIPIPDPKRYQDPFKLVIITVNDICAPAKQIPIGNKGSLAIGLSSFEIVTKLQENPSGFTKWMKARIGMEMV